MSTTTTNKAVTASGNAPKDKQWENLANEAISDAGYWKQLARKAQGERDQLLRAARLAQSVISGADKSGVGQRQAHSALFVAISNVTQD